MEAKNRAVIFLAISALCILATSFLPVFFKPLFVEEKGDMKLISPGFSALLFLIYVYRKRWARMGALILCSISACVLMYFISLMGVNYDKIAGLLFLLLLQIITIMILTNRSVKTFCNQEY